MGEMIEFPSNGSRCGGYVARPADGEGPGVMVIQEWWGLVPHIKDVCDRLAQEGFTALAPDLYHGRTPGEPDAAAKTMMSLRIEEAAADLGGAVDWLAERSGAGRIGVIGFCMGGGLALYIASLRPEVAACVTYYGVGPWPVADPAAIRAEVLGHWGSNDPSAPRDRIDKLESSLRSAGVEVEFQHYQGAGHAFFNDTRPEAHDPDAARTSWDLTLALLRRRLSRAFAT